MSVLQEFKDWWDSLPMDSRMRMNASDCEFVWLTREREIRRLKLEIKELRFELREKSNDNKNDTTE